KQLKRRLQVGQEVFDRCLARLGESKPATLFTNLLPNRAVTGGGASEIPTEREFHDLGCEDISFRLSTPSFINQADCPLFFPSPHQIPCSSLGAVQANALDRFLHRDTMLNEVHEGASVGKSFELSFIHLFQSLGRSDSLVGFTSPFLL